MSEWRRRGTERGTYAAAELGAFTVGKECVISVEVEQEVRNKYRRYEIAHSVCVGGGEGVGVGVGVRVGVGRRGSCD